MINISAEYIKENNHGDSRLEYKIGKFSQASKSVLDQSMFSGRRCSLSYGFWYYPVIPQMSNFLHHNNCVLKNTLYHSYQEINAHVHMQVTVDHSFSTYHIWGIRCTGCGIRIWPNGRLLLSLNKTVTHEQLWKTISSHDSFRCIQQYSLLSIMKSE